MKLALTLFAIWSGLAWAEARLSKTTSGVTVIETRNRAYYTGLLPQKNKVRGLGETYAAYECGELPDEFDLRDVGVVGPIHDQGNCGSCWAFSQSASLESAFAVAGGGLQDLSEQHIVSCDRNNYGCNGGNLNGFQFQIKNGQTGEARFTYAESNGTCKGSLPMQARGISWTNVGASNRRATEKEVMCALYMSQTIPWITVSASSSWSNAPSGSKAVYTRCGGGQTNHAVGLIGWLKVNGKVYFKVRNSWGTKWGSDANRPNDTRGYMMMPLGCDNLGEEVAYIVAGYARGGCQLPTVSLPVETSVRSGEETTLSIRPQAGVDYEWFAGEELLTRGEKLNLRPESTTIYKLVAKNRCGRAETLTRIRVTPP